MISTRLLLLPLALLSAVEAYRQRAKDIRRGVRWLEEGRTVLIRLETPDLTKDQERIDQPIPSSLIFNFTLQDKRILLLNDVSIFPLQNAYVPPRISARLSSISLTEFEHGNLPDFNEAPLFALDYYRKVPHSEHPSARYNIYNTQLDFDVLGVGQPGYDALLSDESQRLIRVHLEELKPYHPYHKPPSQTDFNLSDALLLDRYPNNPFPAPEDLRRCTLWSWRCSDFDEYPWYRYVYRQSFDEYGKIGSFSHMLSQKWGELCDLVGFWQAISVIVVAIGLVLSRLGFRLYRAVQRARLRIRALYKRREVFELQQTYYDEDERLVSFADEEEEEEEAGHNTEITQGVVQVGRSVVDYGKPLPPVPSAASMS